MMTHMDDEQQLLMQVVHRLTTWSSPARVIVFGSMVTGTATAESVRSRDVLGDVAYPAHKYGRVIYEAA